MPNTKLQAVRKIAQRLNHDQYTDSSSAARIIKRKRESDAAIEELSLLEMDSKKRRFLPHREPNMNDSMGESEVDFAILMRKHLVSLHQGLQAHWTCVCHGCSGLGVRLSLPQRNMTSQIETILEVFFEVRSGSDVTFQEAMITIK